MGPAVFDLDGTLITCQARQVAVAVAALEASGYDLNGREDAFWDRKRNGGTTLQAILDVGVPAEVASAAATRWRELIEREEWLAVDQLCPGTPEALQLAADRGFAPVVLTAREHRRSLKWQLSHLGLDQLVREVVVVDPTRSVQEKADALRRLSATAYIADTELDHQASELAAVPFAAVTGGQRSATYLRGNGVHRLYEGIMEAATDMLQPTESP